jgi:16S rRNA G527 N7-methylase RsmG
VNGSFEQALRDGFERCAQTVAPPDEASFQRMLQHAALLERWNKTHNLTSVEGAEQWAEALYIDSWLVRALPLALTTPIVDVGSGGGFPALVMLAGEPERQALFFEKVEKKRSFLAMAIATLGFKQAMVAKEPFPPSLALPKGPHLFTSRATFAPADWLRMAAGVARPGDSVIVQSSQEAPPQAPLGWERVHVVDTALPFSGAKRRLAVYRFTTVEMSQTA